jgi:hypothetical protein
MVFGDAFIYSNCLQHAYPSLRRLATGSIVLFGRHSRTVAQAAFSLDTCLIIDRVEALEPFPFDAEVYGEDILNDGPEPSHTEGAGDAFAVYFGKTRRKTRPILQLLPGAPADDPTISSRAAARADRSA